MCLLCSSAAYSNCWVAASEKYNIDPWLLYSIGWEESNLVSDAVNTNSDGSRDIGIMQINSYWFDKLKKQGIEEKDLYDTCINIHVGAWVLRQSYDFYGNNWRAVGAYNAGTGTSSHRENLREGYAKRIYNNYIRFTERLQ